MNSYTAPIADMRFVMEAVAGLGSIQALPGCEQASDDLVEAILEEAGKLARNVIAPLNDIGDREGSRLVDERVRTPKGFIEAYAEYVAGGWNALPFAPEHGGQGMPLLVSTAVLEMWNSASLGFALCPLLNIGAVDLLGKHGSAEQQATFLPRMITGEWTGTMNLTEPQAGSDVGAVKTRAVKEDGHYRITGQKIFITYGDHDLTPNIIHMVLARVQGAPAGTRGLSLFIVPKFLVAADGAPGARNDIRTVSLEHKLGIHASPTCVLAFGDREGAIGTLVGEENRGIEYMFTMMNNARLNVGLQGVAIAERATQQASDYARQRIQGKPVGAKADENRPILHHPDIRRMLLSMRARTEAARALAYFTAATADRARCNPDSAQAEAEQRLTDLLIPVVKAWCTDLGTAVASTGIQIHGGMGYIEETGAAQHFRDSRICAIYEGTNGIQANDLLGRKLMRDQGEAAFALLARMRQTGGATNPDLIAIRTHLDAGIEALDTATRDLIALWPVNQAEALCGAVPYLRMFGWVTAGWLMALAAAEAEAKRGEEGADRPFLDAKILTARFFAEQYLPPAASLLSAVRNGGTILRLDPERL